MKTDYLSEKFPCKGCGTLHPLHLYLHPCNFCGIGEYCYCCGLSTKRILSLEGFERNENRVGEEVGKFFSKGFGCLEDMCRDCSEKFREQLKEISKRNTDDIIEIYKTLKGVYRSGVHHA